MSDLEQRTAELDALMRRIDKARQEQAAHVIGCGKPKCAECKRLQAGLNKLYRAYALALDAD